MRQRLLARCLDASGLPGGARPQAIVDPFIDIILPWLLLATAGIAWYVNVEWLGYVCILALLVDTVLSPLGVAVFRRTGDGVQSQLARLREREPSQPRDVQGEAPAPGLGSPPSSADRGPSGRGERARGSRPLLVSALILLVLCGWLSLGKSMPAVVWLPCLVAGVGFLAAWLLHRRGRRER